MPPYSNTSFDMPPFCGAFPVFAHNEHVRLSHKRATTSSTETLAEPRNSSSKLPSSRKSKVGFSECLVEIHFVLHRYDISATEREQAWYTKNEIRSIRHSVNDSALKLPKDPLYVPNDESIATWSSRGIIETRTKLSRRNRLTLQEQARNAVFFEQSMQLLDAATDPYQIADSYFEYTGPCQTAAHNMAKQDEKAANNVYDEEPICKQSPPSPVDFFCYVARRIEHEDCDSCTDFSLALLPGL